LRAIEGKARTPGQKGNEIQGRKPALLSPLGGATDPLPLSRGG